MNREILTENLFLKVWKNINYSDIITINVSGQEFLVSRTIIKGYLKTKLAKGLTNFECLTK